MLFVVSPFEYDVPITIYHFLTSADKKLKLKKKKELFLTLLPGK